MRRVPRLLGIISLFCVAAVPAIAQSQRPQFRPAVLGSGPESLINRIDAQALFKAGQKDGAVMFSALVGKNGAVSRSRTYRAMPGSDALEQELRTRLAGAKFSPAIYNHQPADVLLVGTLVFSIVNEKPRVRIFLNQDARELKQASDFIAPQPVFGADSRFSGLNPPANLTTGVGGIVELTMEVDATGGLQKAALLMEEPPLLGFADAAARDFAGAKFIPAFRDGDAVASNIVYVVYYEPPDWQVPTIAP